jgi:hypothetical protein
MNHRFTFPSAVQGLTLARHRAKLKLFGLTIVASNLRASMSGDLKIPRIAVYATDLMAY